MRYKKRFHYNPDQDVRAISRLTEKELHTAKYWVERIQYMQRKYKFSFDPLFCNRDINNAIDGILYLRRKKQTDRSKYKRKGRRING